tara:strand:- start:1028 stop:1270 length:243 start_codon:yes stop_codon:yes gene_type:complete
LLTDFDEKFRNNISEKTGGKFTGAEIRKQLEEMWENINKALAEEKKEDAPAEGAEGGEEEGLQFDGGMATTDPRLASVDD